MTTVPLLPAPKIAGLLPAPRQPHERLIERIIQLDPNPQSKSFWNRVSDTFNTVDDAENLIAHFMRQRLDKADVLWDCFMLIRPHAAMWESSPLARKLHMSELLKRVVYDRDLKPPTRVEMAMTVVAMALKEGHITEDTIPDLADVTLRLEDIPLKDLRKIRSLTPPYERPTPNPQRWHTTVSDRVKRATLGDKYDHYMRTYDRSPKPQPTPVTPPTPKPVPVPIAPQTDPVRQLQLL